MNRVEKFVYDSVKHNPNFKILIRNLYQLAFDLLPNQKNYSVNSISVKEGYFFGFHDVCPFSFDDTKVLANKLTIPLKMPSNKDILEVGFFSIRNGKLCEYTKIGESKAWNYHKGCRLQWAGKSHIIYNDGEENNLVSKLYNIENKITETIPFPIDSASSCGGFATSFSYGRLEMTMQGYGYSYYDDDSLKTEKITDKSGLFLIDLKNNSRELIVNLKELNEKGDLSKYPINEAHQYVTHSLFSFDGRYISFLYRATVVQDNLKRWSQLVVFDRKTKKCYFSPTNEMVSHYVWNQRNEIIAYARTGTTDSHVLFADPSLQRIQRVAYPQLNSDGHQSFINDKAFVADTYPDKYRMAKLYNVNIESNKATLLASLNSYKKFQTKSKRHWCCDLHPRMNRKGDMLCFDSVHTGERAICIMEV